jgi:DNA-binding MurR/RpiR family transcriptional regulator
MTRDGGTLTIARLAAEAGISRAWLQRLAFLLGTENEQQLFGEK